MASCYALISAFGRLLIINQTCPLCNRRTELDIYFDTLRSNTPGLDWADLVARQMHFGTWIGICIPFRIKLCDVPVKDIFQSAAYKSTCSPAGSL